MADSKQDKKQDWLLYPRSMAGPIYEHLGFAISDGGPGWLEVTLTITDQLMNKDGVLHGGMWTLIADACMGGACRTLLDQSARVVTTQMDFRWLRALSGAQLRGVGKVLSQGRHEWHCVAKLYDSEAVQVGFGSASFAIVNYSS